MYARECRAYRAIGTAGLAAWDERVAADMFGLPNLPIAEAHRALSDQPD